MDKSVLTIQVVFFLVLIIIICMAIAHLSPVAGYGILLIWLLVFGIYMWVVFRGQVERKLYEVESDLTSMSPEIYRHKFDYLCPACLYQTNENTGLCPRCGRRELMKTYKHPLDRDKLWFEKREEDDKEIHEPL